MKRKSAGHQRIMNYMGKVIWYCDGSFMVAKGDGTDEYFSTIEDAMKWIEERRRT